MSSVDKEAASQSAMPERIQGRYFAEAHTYALAVQALLASDSRLSKLTSSYLEQAMSVSAPVFDPVKAAQRLEQQYPQSVPGGPNVMGDGASTSSAVSDSDLLRHNIAQMYQYYNQLIFRQGQQSRY